MRREHLTKSYVQVDKPQKRREIKLGNTTYSLVVRDSLELLEKERTSDVGIHNL